MSLNPIRNVGRFHMPEAPEQTDKRLRAVIAAARFEALIQRYAWQPVAQPSQLPDTALAAVRDRSAWYALTSVPPDATGAYRILVFHFAEGSNALVPCGTTGEVATLTADEHRELIARTVEVAKGGVPVIAGCGTYSTATSIERIRAAADVGAEIEHVVTCADLWLRWDRFPRYRGIDREIGRLSHHDSGCRRVAACCAVDEYPDIRADCHVYRRHEGSAKAIRRGQSNQQADAS